MALNNRTVDWVEWRWAHAFDNPQISFDFEWTDGDDFKALPGSPLGIGIIERRALPLNPCSATGESTLRNRKRATFH